MPFRNKIAINQCEYDKTDDRLSFPIHHKHKRDSSLILSDQLHEIDTLDIEQIIFNTYDQAVLIDVKLARREPTTKDLGKFAFLNGKSERHGTCLRV